MAAHLKSVSDFWDDNVIFTCGITSLLQLPHLRHLTCYFSPRNFVWATYLGSATSYKLLSAIVLDFCER